MPLISISEQPEVGEATTSNAFAKSYCRSLWAKFMYLRNSLLQALNPGGPFCCLLPMLNALVPRAARDGDFFMGTIVSLQLSAALPDESRVYFVTVAPRNS